MNINLKSLLLGTSLSLIPLITNAQCVATTDCATLGYTETTNKGGCLKCPFGNTFACPMSETDFCEKYEFKYACTGTGYTAGLGKACNKKYAFCVCDDGYEWKGGVCEKIRPKCKIGWYYYSNGTCSEDIIAGKEIIGVVFYLNPDGIGGQALAMQYAGSYHWSTEYIDIPGLENKACVERPGYRPTFDCSKATSDVSSCANTKLITESCEENVCTAAWAARNYVPSNAPETKGRWCLPAYAAGFGMWNNIQLINQKLREAGGEELDSRFNWSSTESSYSEAFGWNYSVNQYGTEVKYAIEFVRPVIEF